MGSGWGSHGAEIDIEIPADGVSTVSFKASNGSTAFPRGLAHLPSVLILHVSKDND